MKGTATMGAIARTPHLPIEARERIASSTDFPVRARLERWRLHCEREHGASPGDYKLNVLGWHRRVHPGCAFSASP